MSSKYIKYKGLTYKMVDADDPRDGTKPADEVFDFKRIEQYCNNFISLLSEKEEYTKKAVAEAKKIKQKLLDSRKLPAKKFRDLAFLGIDKNLRALSFIYNVSDDDYDYDGFRVINYTLRNS